MPALVLAGETVKVAVVEEKIVDLAGEPERMYDNTLRSGRTSNRGVYKRWRIETEWQSRTDQETLRDAIEGQVVPGSGDITGSRNVFCPAESIDTEEYATLDVARLRFVIEAELPE